MPLPAALPYGLRDVKVATLGPTGTKGTLVDLPNARTFSFSEAEDFEELRGDDKVVASRGKGPSVEWALESGGISFEALVVMGGGAVVESGTTPAIKKTYSKLATDSRPYFYVEGQSISDSGGDFHTILYRCKTTDNIEGEQGDGAFWLTSAGGVALPSVATATLDALYDFVQNETATPIV